MSREEVLEGYLWDLYRGHPWLPGAVFKTHPELGEYIRHCLEEWASEPKDEG